MPKDETKTTAARPRLGFTDKGEAYPGVDPQTGERVTVTLEALKSEFGAKVGEEKYRQIRHITHAGDIFHNLAEDARDIPLSYLRVDVRDKVNEILSAKE